MTKYDYAVLGFYFAYLLTISWVVRRFVHNVSDYFRSGGQVLWWMAGGSAFMASFSAWTFTGAASRAYGDGWPIMVIYLGNALGFLLSALYFAPRFRQLRVITAMQAVRARFGPANEQFFTWLTVPLRMMYAGIWLYGLAVFFSAAFQMDVTRTILLAGGTVMTIALISGSWAVVASDFIQVLILMPVTVVAAVLAVAKLGGPMEYVHRLAPTRLNPGKLFSDDFLLLWCAAILVKQFVSANNLTESARFLCVKDSRHARKAALLAAGLMLVGVFLWFTPPMAASLTHPDLAGVYPRLANPGEGSFFAMATAIFPVGMLGLLVSGVFAATVASMDAGLNNNAGFLIKNFYQPIVRPLAGDRELLIAGKLTTLALGVTIILLAQGYRQLHEMSLFELMLSFGTLVALPQSMPLVLGIFIRRTPRWSGWSTVVVGFATSFATRRYLRVSWAVRIFGSHHAVLSTWERQNWEVGIAVFTIVGVCTAWFCATRFFYRSAPAADQAAVEAFSRQIETPVDYDREEAAAATDDKQSWLIGWLCLPYGLAICLMAFIPNPAGGRLAFVFCGGVVAGIGALLVKSARPGRAARHAAGLAPKLPGEPASISVLVLVITSQEAADFLPEPLMAEARSLAVECHLIDSGTLTAEGFRRKLAELNPEVLVACWSTPPLPDEIPARLRYVCYLAGSVKKLMARGHLERGLLVSNWGGSVARVVAECALLLTLAALRRMGHWIPAMHRAGAWKNGRTETGSLFGRRVGLHGFGKVARELCRLLAPFGVELGICAPETDPALYEAFGARRIATLEELFSDSDVVIELAPLIPSTVGLINEPLLRLLRPGGVFVNAGRGAVVDEAALLRVAREGRIQVALDVYATEPLPANSGLRGLANVVLLPHLAGPTIDRQRDAGAFGLRNLRAYAEGGPLEAVITTAVFDGSS